MLCRECGKLAPLHLQSEKFQKEYEKLQKMLDKLGIGRKPETVILAAAYSITPQFCWGGGKDTYYLVERIK